MVSHETPKQERQLGIMVRLARDPGGNALAIMCAMLVPLIGFTGSAVDAARLYVVRTRLQQACDAGVLAGRKFMTDNNASTALDDTAKARAGEFFANNFRAGWFQTTDVSFTPIKASDTGSSTTASAVQGNATATVPMTVMNFFGMQPVKLNVACRAHFDLADTDVMFVLDVTGSMSCAAGDSATCVGATRYLDLGNGVKRPYNEEVANSKIEALRKAVLKFDSVMRANADPTTNYRYGFAPYSSSVNIGYSIPNEYLENGSANYSTRRVTGSYDAATQTASDATLTGVTNGECTAKRSPATGYKPISSYYGAYVWTAGVSWKSTNGGTCTGPYKIVRPQWTYSYQNLDISTYVTGAATANPSRLDGSTSRWPGCVEEVNVTPAPTSFNDIDNLPEDADPDNKPQAGNKWRPIWPEAVWLRTGTSQVVNDGSINETSSSNRYNFNYGQDRLAERSFLVACNMPAQRLKDAKKNPNIVTDYVRDQRFRAFGYTYHDVGMLWGTRMLSPRGAFAADTTAYAGRNTPTRALIFMTDGFFNTPSEAYTQWGVEDIDGRQGTYGDDATEQKRHVARFRAICDYAKTRLGITVYVIAFGKSVSMNSDLKACASPGQDFQAPTDDKLSEVFSDIAERIAMLRLTQ